MLALTFGRKAATELRDRVTARLGGGLVPTVATFHSFAYSLLRRTDSPEDYLDPPRLMSGAEEDVRIRELLRGAVADGTVAWPEDLVGALPTLGLANEVRAVLTRARELGLEDGDLRRIGRGVRATGVGRRWGSWPARSRRSWSWRTSWTTASCCSGHWSGRTSPRCRPCCTGSTGRSTSTSTRTPIRCRWRCCARSSTPQTTLVAVGDPDQAIYGFRGADVGGLLRFPKTFRTVDDEPAPVVVLGRTRRFGPRIRSVATAVLGARLPPGLPAEQLRAHRHPDCVPVDDPAVERRRQRPHLSRPRRSGGPRRPGAAPGARPARGAVA